MHSQDLQRWQHSHDFSLKNDKGEHRIKIVLVLTALTMMAEIAAGAVYGSMALLADGWHMGTHVAAFMITLFAYRYARKHADSPAFSFGTGKVNVLGGFASAIALALVALVMLVESLLRIVDPHTIRFDEAIFVASLGLLINVVSAFLLKDDHGHGHDHSLERDHTLERDDSHERDDNQKPHHHHDHNLTAAYLHVLADALTSVLAIAALIAGKYLGFHWLDPVMGVVGAVIITRWSYGLVKQTSPILLDASIDEAYRGKIIEAIEKDSDNKIYDLHVWKISANHHAAIISLLTHHPRPTAHYRQLLHRLDKLSHITIEVNKCPGTPCARAS